MHHSIHSSFPPSFLVRLLLFTPIPSIGKTPTDRYPCSYLTLFPSYSSDSFFLFLFPFNNSNSSPFHTSPCTSYFFFPSLSLLFFSDISYKSLFSSSFFLRLFSHASVPPFHSWLIFPPPAPPPPPTPPAAAPPDRHIRKRGVQSLLVGQEAEEG